MIHSNRDYVSNKSNLGCYKKCIKNKDIKIKNCSYLDCFYEYTNLFEVCLKYLNGERGTCLHESKLTNGLLYNNITFQVNPFHQT